MPEVFELFLIKPSHYDDDGYLIQWLRTYTPSNSLAALYGIARDCSERRIFGPDVELRITVMDEVVTRIPVKKIIRQIKRSGGKGLVALVGVQSNQFPRAVDLARRFAAAGLPACIGGFHAAGSLAMPFGKGDIAIDAVPTPAEIDRALTKLEAAARERGVAVGTASALPVSIERIGVWTKTLGDRGILLVPLTTAMLKSKSS